MQIFAKWSHVQVWQSVSEDRDVLRKQYVKTIVPPFAALLRRWRPLLSGIHELTDSQGQSPLAVEDRPLATDVHPLEVMDYLLIDGTLTCYICGLYKNVKYLEE